MILAILLAFFFLLFVASSGLGADNQAHIYPANPSIHPQGVYVSSQGVTRFDRKTLKRIWHVLTDVEALEPVATDSAILIATRRGLYALDPAKGTNLWHLASDRTLFPPAVATKVAFVGGLDGSLRALALDTGRVLWRRNFDGWLYTPAIVGNLLVVGGKEALLRGIDTSTGDTLWTKPLDQELVYRPVEVPGGRAVVTLFDGRIVMINAEDGATQWQAQDPTPSFSPAVSGKRLYFGAFDGSLRARSQDNGRLLWEQQLQGKLRFLPYVIDDIVLVASDQGEIAAYGARKGRRLWRYLHKKEFIASPIVLDDVVIGFPSNTDVFSRDAPFLSESQP